MYDEQGRPFTDAVPKCNADDARLPSLDSMIHGGSGAANRTPSQPCVLKIYRLAIAGTADYTAYFGSQANAIANTVALINNLNALYEREVTVRFTLVTGNNLMYTDAASDPFTNSGALPCDELAASRANFVSVLGVANYDLGVTVYGQNFGGCAYVGAACSNNNKGGATGGYSSPTPTSYLLEVLAHEIGHLYSAGHSHNAADGACTASPTSAWEPGGGSTIMAYGSSCNIDYTTYNTGLYFHGGSLGQMRSYIASANGGCYTTGATNTTPLITTPTDATFYIPVSTPFKLSANASDAEDNNTLTYTFEQMDLGTGSAVPPSPTTATGPIIRSFEPSPKSYRYIPRMDSILNNIIPTFESLPSVNRSLTFWATVRDNHSGCGCTSVDTISVATSGSTPFRVTSQSSTTTAAAGSSVTVTWNVAGTTASPFSTANVQILFAGDGLNYNTVLAASTPNDGSQSVMLPNISTTNGRIMVAAIGNIFFDINDANITIQPSCGGVQTSQIFPEENLTALQGNAALQLNLVPAFGQPTDTLGTEITTANPTGTVGASASSTDTTCRASWSGRYTTFKFQLGASGNYNVSLTRSVSGSSNFFSLYNASGYAPANACTNYLFRSNTFYSNNIPYYYNSFNFTGVGNTVYNIAFVNQSNDPGSYRLTLSGPGKIFTEFKNATSNYGYVVVNSAGTIVLTSTASPDLTGLAADTYYVYGLSYTPGLNIASYQNQPFSSLEAGSFTGGNCASLSNNRKQVTIMSSVILPLTYVQLTAKAATGGNALQWKVSDDDDANGAAVEHSTDGRTYSTIATLAKGQNRVSTALYSYLHKTPAAVTNYYRIQQYDSRGNYLYSNVAVVTTQAKRFVSVSPNPTSGQVTIRTSGQAVFVPFTVKVYDNSGRIVKQVLVNRSAYTFDMSALASGVYMLVGDGITEKIIKR